MDNLSVGGVQLTSSTAITNRATNTRKTNQPGIPERAAGPGWWRGADGIAGCGVRTGVGRPSEGAVFCGGVLGREVGVEEPGFRQPTTPLSGRAPLTAAPEPP